MKDTEAATKAGQRGDNLPTQVGRQCRFRLGNDSSATVTLPDSRKFGYAEYGQPNGNHHVLGSAWARLGKAWHDEHEKEIRARTTGVSLELASS